MPDAHEVFGLKIGATPEEIRARYLQLVRENPPDRAPERFAEIRAAYDVLRDPAKQLARQVFSCQSADTLESLRAELSRSLTSVPLTLQTLLSLADSA